MPTSSSNLRTALAAHPERFRVATALLAERLAATPQPTERPRFPRIPRMSGGSQPEAVLGRLHALGLSGMAEAFFRAAGDDHDGLRHADWLMHLLDSEVSERAQRRLRARLRSARLRYPASVENVDYCASRGLDRTQFQTLASGRWIADGANLIIEGPTGVGKSWLACSLGQKACRDDRPVLYQRAPRMFSDLALGRGTGRYRRLMRHLGSVDLLILDDWGLEPLGADQRHDMMEIVEERCGRKSTLIASQIPVERWSELIGEPTLAGVMLDRFIPYARRLQLKGDSRRAQQMAAD
jgi:DNA replication protein DnaC